MTITKELVDNFTFKEYVKVGVTKISDQILSTGSKVLTLEGEYTCAESSRLAVDSAGNIYPIAESIFDKCYVLK